MTANGPSVKYTDQCLVQHGNKYRNSQLDNVHRVKDFGTLSSKQDVFIKSVSSEEKEAERL